MREPRPDWSPVGVNFKILDEHRHLFYIRFPPGGGGGLHLSSPMNMFQIYKYINNLGLLEMYLGLPISNLGSPKGSRKIFLGSSLALFLTLCFAAHLTMVLLKTIMLFNFCMLH